MSIQAYAAQALTEQGIYGALSEITPNRWQLRGSKDGNGVSLDIEGQPDEAFIGEAVKVIAKELST